MGHCTNNNHTGGAMTLDVCGLCHQRVLNDLVAARGAVKRERRENDLLRAELETANTNVTEAAEMLGRIITG